MALNFTNALKIFATALDKATDEKFTLSKAEKQLLNANGSITRLVGKYVLKPTLIITDNTATEVWDKVVDMNIDIFTAFYTQAFKIMSEINGMESTVAFDLLGSDSNYKAINLLTIENPSLEDFDFLPLKENMKKAFAMEAKPGEDVYATSITKSFEITINVKDDKGNSEKIVVPMVIKTNVIKTPLKSIINVLDSEDENSLGERWDAWRSGAITGKEFFFASDLIEKYKKAKLNDKDELMNFMAERTNAAYSKTGKGGVGFSTFYSMIIISEREVDQISRVLKTKLLKEKGKDKFLNKMKALSVTVVDDMREEVVLLTKDISGVSHATFKSLKKSKSGNNMDDILKSLLLNKSPII